MSHPSSQPAIKQRASRKVNDTPTTFPFCLQAQDIYYKQDKKISRRKLVIRWVYISYTHILYSIHVMDGMDGLSKASEDMVWVGIGRQRKAYGMAQHGIRTSSDTEEDMKNISICKGGASKMAPDSSAQEHQSCLYMQPKANEQHIGARYRTGPGTWEREHAICCKTNSRARLSACHKCDALSNLQ